MEEIQALHLAFPGPRLIVGDFNLIYRAANKNNASIDRAMMGQFVDFSMMSARRRLSFLDVGSHGPMRGPPRHLCSWIVPFAPCLGRVYSLATCCIAWLRECRIIAPSSSPYAAVPLGTGAFTLEVSGHNWRACRKHWLRHGRTREM